MKSLKTLLLVSTVSFAVTSGASAESYRFSTWLPDSESTSVVAREFTVPEIAKRTNGSIEFEMFTGGALMPPKAHLAGTGDGVTQYGFHTSGYTPSDLPIANAVSGFGFVEPDPTIIGFAWTDFLMHDPAQNAEFQQHNVVPLGGFSTPTYPALCASEKPIVTLDDIKGKKIRLPGGLTANLAEYVGAVPVNIPAPEIYQALQTGQIDCAGIVPLWLNIDNTLDEVVKSVTLLEWTGSFNSPIALYNKDWWQGLSNEERQVLIDVAAEGTAKIQVRFTVLTQKAYDDAHANKGVVIVKPDASIENKVQEWKDAGYGDMAGIAKNTYGIADPEALFATFTPYIDKWRGLLEGVDRADEAKLAALLKEHMTNDIDPATYGMK